MTIRKGSDYGVLQPLPEGASVARSDAELRTLIVANRDRGNRPVTVGLLGGDLCKTLGGSGDMSRLSGPDALTVPVDLVVASIDGVEIPFVSHLVVGKLFGSGFAVVMNSQWIGPRSHPGDGLIDITTGSLGWRQRRQALLRSATGTHLPHPSLTYRRVRSETLSFDRPVPLHIDGSLRMKGQTLSLRVEPDAFHVVV
jgi:hypothetical protein